MVYHTFYYVQLCSVHFWYTTTFNRYDILLEYLCSRLVGVDMLLPSV